MSKLRKATPLKPRKSAWGVRGSAAGKLNSRGAVIGNYILTGLTNPLRLVVKPPRKRLKKIY
jgi:hypothetical protein